MWVTHFQPAAGSHPVSHKPLLPYSVQLMEELQQRQDKEEELGGGMKSQNKKFRFLTLFVVQIVPFPVFSVFCSFLPGTP